MALPPKFAAPAAAPTDAQDSELPGEAPDAEDQAMNEAQATGDMHTLIAAHKIQADKPRHLAAKAMAKKHLAAFKAIASKRNAKQ